MTDLSLLPAALAQIIEDFDAVPPADRLQLLVELADELPDLPPRYAENADRLEQVHECQSPLFLAVELETADGEPGRRVVRLYFDAPRESPTTRAFAAILHTGLDGQPADAVLAVPDDFYVRMGIADAVSPLRIRGLAAMLSRIKRHVRQDVAA